MGEGETMKGGPIISSEPATAVYAVYGKDGEIIHMHEIEIVPNARVSDQAMEAQAIELASRITGRSKAEVAAISIRKEDLKLGVAYKVDTKSKMLVGKAGTKLDEARMKKNQEPTAGDPGKSRGMKDKT